MRTPAAIGLTALAMCAFAANSLLCRLALVDPTIDPASFTAVRLVSGAVALAALIAARSAKDGSLAKLIEAGAWRSAFALFAYAATFSFAYVTLGASMGALILFGAVQITMIGVGAARGERLAPMQMLGAAAAVAGLIYLLSPGVHAPSPTGAALMAGAGVAWGAYSLFGRSERSKRFDPTLVTAANFVRSVPFALALLLPFLSTLHLSTHGIVLAIISGAITSGLGYAVWYAALKSLSASEAAIVQLTVPVIAAAGAIVFLSEDVTLRFVIASVAILGGVAIVLTAKRT